MNIAIIGAGPSGITAAKNAIQAGFNIVVFEKNNKVGGNWVFNSTTGHSSVYENTHIISSKVWSEYEDYPMPASYPDYPKHDLLQLYFENYAKDFHVLPHIKFNYTVTQVRKIDKERWEISYTDAEQKPQTAIFDALMVCNGHHWHPKYPEYPGAFNGKILHSHDFKGVDDTWRGKNILVIGAGNSGCDVAVESARVAKRVCLSMRSPQWFVPKFIFGYPTDVFAAKSNWMPKSIKNHLLKWTLRLLQGAYGRYNLPEHQVLPLSAHPTANSDLLDFIRHGKINPKPAIKKLDGDYVEFANGEREKFDIICACTGFWTVFPFFDKSFIDFQHVDKIPLYRKMMHAEHPTLYFIGLFQPIGCIWPLADYQAKLACYELLGKYKRPSNLNAAIQHEIDNPHFPFIGGQRHAVEVDYHGLRNDLKKELRQVGLDIGEPPQGRKTHYKTFQFG